MRVLDTNPEWLDAVRSRLLTRELLAMPQTLADLAETTDRRFGEIDSRLDGMDRRFEGVDRRFEGVDRRLDAMDRRLDAMEHRLDAMDRRLDAMDRRLDAMDRRLDAMDRRLDAMERRLQRLEDRTGMLVGAHARNEALREIVLLVSEMGMTKMRRLWSLEDVHALVQAGDTTGIPANELRSFRRADAIVEAEDGEGRTCYIAAEVSFTVNGRDTTRAIRNAGYMTRFTGEQAYPAVIGVRIDEQIRETLESDDVYWYRLDPQTLEAE